MSTIDAMFTEVPSTEGALVPFNAHANALDVIREPAEIAFDLAKIPGWMAIAGKLKDEELLKKAAAFAVETRYEAARFYKANVQPKGNFNATMVALKSSAPELGKQLGVGVTNLKQWANDLIVDDPARPGQTKLDPHAFDKLYTKWHDAIWREYKEKAAGEKRAEEAWTAAQMQPYLLRLSLEETGIHMIAAAKHYENCGGDLGLLGISRGEVAPAAPVKSSPSLREATATIVKLEAELQAQHENHKREIAALRAELSAPAADPWAPIADEPTKATMGLVARVRDCSSKRAFIMQHFADGSAPSWSAQARGVHTQIVDDFYALTEVEQKDVVRLLKKDEVA